MNSKFPSLLKCFLFTLKQCTTNLACAPFFLLRDLFLFFLLLLALHGTAA